MAIKKEFRYFTIFEHEKEEAYLRTRHKEGWRFVKVCFLGIYHFEEAAPEDVIYQLDYNQEGSAHKEEYIKMFADCGWEYLQEYVGYSYFRKSAAAMQGEESIFCDDSSRLAMMDRVFRGRMIPLLLLFCTVLLPQFILNAAVYHNYWTAAFYGGALLLYVAVFIGFAVSYRRFRDGTPGRRE